jgi:hypothetical protein
MKISLGDWYDSHSKGEFNVDSVAETARMHAAFIGDANHTCLLGNHDMPYAFPGIESLWCSGHAEWKRNHIDRAKVNWDKTQLFAWVSHSNKEWLISHAGFHPMFAHPVTGFTFPYLFTLCQTATENLKSRRVDDILRAGRKRGGIHPVGGCTWHDFREFVPTPGINQIVGHTHNPGIPDIITEDSQNYCLDRSNGKHYLGHVAILEDDGTFHIEEV